MPAGAALVGMAPTAASAAYPERPINMIVAYAPGGGTDIIARDATFRALWKEMPWSDK